MPEAAMDKDDLPEFSEDNVRLAGQGGVMCSERNAETAGQALDY
jgi:hypothetical protein